MSRPELTVRRLVDGGFEEVGCWEINNAGELAHSIVLPREAGVYAFAIDDVVQYVGLASRSLHQRLNLYRKPGASQRTNIRLNGIIKGYIEGGAVVRIFVAHPPEQEWNGFRVKGAEGLEAGLIAEFGLPWNMRGTTPPATRPQSGSVDRPTRSQSSPTGDRLLELIKRRPGMTELELARTLHGPSAVQQQVNQECRKLVRGGKVSRRGAGGAADPFTYFPSK